MLLCLRFIVLAEPCKAKDSVRELMLLRLHARSMINFDSAKKKECWQVLINTSFAVVFGNMICCLSSELSDVHLQAV